MRVAAFCVIAACVVLSGIVQGSVDSADNDDTASPPDGAGSAPSAASAAMPSDAPFGLRWLASKEDVAALGVILTDETMGQWGRAYTATNLPKALSDQAATQLRFGYDNKLVSIAVFGTGHENDPYASAARGRYEELRAVLEQKYGRPKITAHTDEYYDGKNFTLGLEHKHNWIIANFENKEMTLELSVRALSGSTCWVIIAEHKVGMKSLSTQKGAREKDAL